MPLSLQLYSMRDVPDQLGLLDQLSALGIAQVEGFGGVYDSPMTYRAAMDRSGITMPSGHIGLDDLETDFDGSLALAKALGMARVFAPYLEESQRPTQSEGYVALAQRLNTLQGRFADHGLQFGWHNHDFEFVTLKDGALPMQILLEHAPNLLWEADLAWVARAGCDPLAFINRFGDRLSAIHVKDIAASGTHLEEGGWADLGAGTLDWATLLKACRDVSDDLLYILEHDAPSDPLRFARQSAAAFQSLWGTPDA
ncbi:MAG: sugar phosphate isomerase/epimerase family protein [Paracoccaceae bacterium]